MCLRPRRQIAADSLQRLVGPLTQPGARGLRLRLDLRHIVRHALTDLIHPGVVQRRLFVRLALQRRRQSGRIGAVRNAPNRSNVHVVLRRGARLEIGGSRAVGRLLFWPLQASVARQLKGSRPGRTPVRRHRHGRRGIEGLAQRHRIGGHGLEAITRRTGLVGAGRQWCAAFRRERLATRRRAIQRAALRSHRRADVIEQGMGQRADYRPRTRQPRRRHHWCYDAAQDRRGRLEIVRRGIRHGL